MKKVVIALVIVIILVGGALFYLKQRKSKDFEPLIKARLEKLVHDASQGLYRLDIGGLEIDVLKSKIVLAHIHLVPDTLLYQQMEKLQKAPNDIFDVYVDKLSLEQIDVAALTANGDITLNKLFIDAPVVKVWHKKQAYNIPPDSTKTLYQQISKDIGKIKIDTILVRDVNFTHYNTRLNKKVKFDNVKLIFTGLLMDSATQFDQSRFLYAEDCRINLKNYEVRTSDNLYRFSAGTLEIRTRDQLMEMEKISLKPRLEHKDFYKKVKHQHDIFDIELRKLEFHQVEWWSLLAEESFLAPRMNIADGNIKVYNDKSVAPDTASKLGKFPNQLLAKLPFTIKVNNIGLSHVNVSYEEYNPKSEETGTLFFDDVNGIITNATNDPDLIRLNHFCKVDVRATFLKKTPLKAVFLFDLMNSKQGNFSVQATIGALNNEQLNKILMPLALVKLNSLNVKGLDVSIKGDNYRGTGTVKLLYDDLNITALKNAGDTLKKRALLSFIANNFIIKKENPGTDGKVRIGDGYHLHERNKSFFNLVWKTIFEGAAKTVGYKTKEKK